MCVCVCVCEYVCLCLCVLFAIRIDTSAISGDIKGNIPYNTQEKVRLNEKSIEIWYHQFSNNYNSQIIMHFLICIVFS